MMTTIAQIDPNGHWQTPEGGIKYKHYLTLTDGTQGTAYSDSPDLGFRVGDSVEYSTKQTRKGMSITLNHNQGRNGQAATSSTYASTDARDLAIARQVSIKSASDIVASRYTQMSQPPKSSEVAKEAVQIAQVFTQWILTGRLPQWMAEPKARAHPAQVGQAQSQSPEPLDTESDENDLPF